MKTTIILALALVAAVPMHAIEQSKPNILLILIDDQGYADAGFRDPEVHTPNLDKLVASGVELKRFYAAPVCSPTRAGLMTGLYPIRFGMQRAVNRPFSEVGLPESLTTLPEALGEAGYKQRHIVGKWHLGNMRKAQLPMNHGFTLLDAAGTPIGDEMELDGQSAMALWEGKAGAARRDFEFHSFYERRSKKPESLSVITGNWKLIREGPAILDGARDNGADIALYDLENDIGEESNLAAQHPQLVDELLEKLVAFRKLRPEGGVPPMVEPEPKGWKPFPNWEPVE